VEATGDGLNRKALSISFVFVGSELSGREYVNICKNGTDFQKPPPFESWH
jgi:hypothetical protein